uniref:Uncharacterized protein n=1 Tax=uncultured Thiotrichaceae bacterium TaxID=298394 RepID=A0A6S6TYD9_9GAMM|nr:MAG: Unknown protein [uncultured Thiotrichaceae bacterium]
MAGLTLLQQIAKQLDISEEELTKRLSQTQEELDQLTAVEKVLGEKQDLADDVLSSDLNQQLKSITALLAEQQEQLEASSTQPAKAAAAAQLAETLAPLTDQVTGAVDAREATRDEAFARNFQDLLLDQSTPGSGARSQRTQEVLAQQLDAITNGTIAAEELATDGSLFGFLARSVVGNPFEEGVAAAKERQDTLQGAYANVLKTADATFEANLKKDAPLSETLAGYNAEVSEANAQAKATESKLLIDPIQSGLDAQGTGLEIAAVQAETQLSKDLFQIETNANDRDIAQGRFAFNAQTAVSESIFNRARQAAQDSTNFIESDINGNPVDTTEYDGLNRQNSASILDNQAVTSDSVLKVKEATGEFDIPTQVTRAAEAAVVTKFHNAEAIVKAMNAGVANTGTVPASVVTAAAEYHERQMLENGTALRMAENAAENVERTVDNQNLSAQETNRTLKENEKTFAKRAGYARAKLAADEAALVSEAKTIVAKKESKKVKSEADLIQEKIKLDLWKERWEVHQTAKNKQDRTELAALEASNSLAKARRDNKNLTDTERQQLERTEAIGTLTQQIYNNSQAASPEARAAGLVELSNKFAQIKLEAKNAEIMAALTSSPDYVSSSIADQKEAKKRAQIKANYDMAELVYNQANQQKELDIRGLANEANETTLINQLKDLKDTEFMAQKKREEKEQIAYNKKVRDKSLEEFKTEDQRFALMSLTYKQLTNKNIDAKLLRGDSQNLLLKVATEGKLGNDPYESLVNLSAILVDTDKSEMFKEVARDMEISRQAASATGKVGQDTNLINVNVNEMINAPATANITLKPSNQNRNLSSVPTRKSLLADNNLNFVMSESVASIPRWDTNSVQENLRGLKDYYISETGDTYDSKVVGKQVADTMAAIMRAKGNAGQFKLLGIPAITELNFKAEIPTNIIEDLQGVFSLGVIKNVPLDIDVMSPTGINVLIDNGLI